MLESKNLLFTQRFAPKTLEEMSLPDRIQNQFKSGVYTHTLLHGTPGTGKSTLAKIISSNHNTLYVNASLDRGIDVLRSQVTDFCSSASINFDNSGSSLKVVILDEIDGVSLQFFDALKGFMDQFSTTTRFIGVSNYINKIPEPIQSRFELVNFDPQSPIEERQMMERYAKRLHTIVTQNLELKFDNDAFMILIKKNFPDFRDALQDIQRFEISGVKQITKEILSQKTYEFVEIYDMILNGSTPEDMHKLLIGKYASKVTEVLQSLDDPFISYIMNTKTNFIPIVPNIITDVCHYQSILHNVIDPAIAMKACVFTLMGHATKIRTK